MTKRKKKAARQARDHGRDKFGRFKPGHSGNPKGRPPKQPETPKLPDELLAEKFLQKVEVTRADGTTRTISAYERLIEDLVASFSTAKLREKMQMIEWLEKRSLFHRMLVLASGDAENPFDEDHDTWLEARTSSVLMRELTRKVKPTPANSGKKGKRKDKDNEDVEHWSVYESPRDLEDGAG